MREKDLERKLCDGVKNLGGRAVKFTSPYVTGMPDRLVLLPGGRCFFVEIKTREGRLSPVQRKRHGQLRSLGCLLFVVRDEASLQHCLSVLGQL